MTGDTPVDRLYRESTAVVSVLRGASEPSLLVSAEDNFRKTVLLASASHFEYRVSSIVAEFVREASKGSILVEQFVRNKAISRMYHTWFEWGANNANQFFGLFGKDFYSSMCARVKSRDDLQTSIKAFLELGNERNRLIHQDYASFALDKTMDDIYALYKTGALFVDDLPVALRECDAATRALASTPIVSP